MSSNCVLLTIDSLRADHATGESGLMPTLNELAASGVSFSRAYANGYSTPISFPTLLTGTYANHHGGPAYMADERPFLASKLAAAGYETAAFQTNPHLRVEKNYDVGFGTFNDFDDEAGGLSRLRYLVTQNLDSDSRLYALLKRLYHLFRTTSGSADYAEAPTLNDRALDWLDGEWNRESPFFLWIHYMDVHYPFYPPEEFRQQVTDRTVPNGRAISLNGKMHEDGAELTAEEVADLRALYRGEVRYTDHHIGELLAGLRERDCFDDTLFLVTSDHGELFGEHGLFGHPPSGYEESYHVPLVARGPTLPEGRTVDAPATLLDVPPTVTEVLDIDGDPRWDGESLVPATRGEGTAEDGTAVLGDSRDVLACQTGEWRLVWWREVTNPGDPGNEWELRDLDVGQRVPLDDHEAVVERLRDRLQGFVERAEAADSVEAPDVDGTTEQRLEALGYR
jgi:arylsulfatase A-like enzyme